MIIEKTKNHPLVIVSDSAATSSPYRAGRKSKNCIADEYGDEVASSFLLAMTHFLLSPSADKLRAKAGRTMLACAMAGA